MNLHRIRYEFIFFVVAILISCKVVTPTIEPKRTVVTDTVTPISQETLITDTYTPENDQSVITETFTPEPICDLDEVLTRLKLNVPYEEFDLTYMRFPEGNKLLNLWYVDPAIHMDRTQEEIFHYLNVAMIDTEILVRKALLTDECTRVLFDELSVTAVDSDYERWLSQSIDLTTYSSESELINVIYEKERLLPILDPTPENSCNWPEAHEDIVSLFESSYGSPPPNFGFNVVRTDFNIMDISGLTTYLKNFSNQTEFIELLILDTYVIAQKLVCLYPEPMFLKYAIVDETGEMIFYIFYDGEFKENIPIDEFIKYLSISDVKNDPFNPITITTGTQTITPSPIHNCDKAKVLSKLKSNIPYDEFEMTYTVNKNGNGSLLLWVVDPLLNPNATELEIEQNIKLAKHNSFDLATHITNTDECTQKIIETIGTIFVDSNYVSWLSQSYKVKPGPVLLTEPESFLRNTPPPTISTTTDETCTWNEARENISRHFGYLGGNHPENFGFYYIIDDQTSSVFAHWTDDVTSGKNDTVGLNLAGAANVANELTCLNPKPDTILFTVVDKDQQPLFIGYYEGELPDPFVRDIDNLIENIIYKYYGPEP